MADQTAGGTFRVVVNDEDQFSVWPAGRELPIGWREQGATGTRQECLDAIGDLWTDLRPRSLREHMAEP